MKKMKRYLYGMCLFVILMVSFNNCSDSVYFRQDTSLDLLHSKDIIVGNPLVSKMLLAKMCKVITSCHPEVTADACNAGIMNTTRIETQLGIPAGSMKLFSDIVQSEGSGQLAATLPAANLCASQIETLTCGNSLVQGAYDPTASDPFAGVAFMIPTTVGSCPAVFSQPIARTEYYVSPTGSDLNDGSASKPWATINHASDALVAGPEGATVHVAPGNYYPPTSAACAVTQTFRNSCGIRTTKAGTATAPILYISDQLWGAKIIPADAYSAWYNSGDYVKIIGFEVIGNSATNIGIQSDGSFVRVEKNNVHDVPVALGCSRGIGGGGISHTNISAHDNESIGNVVHDIGPVLANGLPFASYCNHAHGIYHQQPRGNIHNNLIYRVGAWGITSWYNATNLNITNNLIFSNGHTDNTGWLLGGAISVAASLTSHDYTTVSNNIIRNNYGEGIDDKSASGTHNLYLNNVFFANGRDYDFKAGTVTTGSVLSDPMMIAFRMDGTGDYRLSANSPAINAGTEACAVGSGCSPSNDYSGFLRPYGAALDIGPFEWHP